MPFQTIIACRFFLSGKIKKQKIIIILFAPAYAVKTHATTTLKLKHPKHD